jgi:hypothetical protein
MSSATCRARRQHAEPPAAIKFGPSPGELVTAKPTVPHPGKCQQSVHCPRQTSHASSSASGAVRRTDSSRVFRHSPKYAPRGKPKTRPQRKQFAHGLVSPLASGDVFCLLGRVSKRSDESNRDRGSTLPLPVCAGTTPCIATDTGLHRGSPDLTENTRNSSQSKSWPIFPPLPGPKPEAVTSPSSECNCQLPGADWICKRRRKQI